MQANERDLRVLWSTLGQSEARMDQVEPQRVMNQAASLKRARV